MMATAGVDPIDYLIWRPALSSHIKDDLKTIQTRWTLADMARAHLALDMIEVLEPDPPEPPKTKAGR